MAQKTIIFSGARGGPLLIAFVDKTADTPLSRTPTHRSAIRNITRTQVIVAHALSLLNGPSDLFQPTSPSDLFQPTSPCHDPPLPQLLHRVLHLRFLEALSRSVHCNNHGPNCPHFLPCRGSPCGAYFSSSLSTEETGCRGSVVWRVGCGQTMSASLRLVARGVCCVADDARQCVDDGIRPTCACCPACCQRVVVSSRSWEQIRIYLSRCRGSRGVALSR